MPFQRRDNTFGRGFVGGHVGRQSDLSQRPDGFWSACNLASQAKGIDEVKFEIDASGKAKESP